MFLPIRSDYALSSLATKIDVTPPTCPSGRENLVAPPTTTTKIFKRKTQHGNLKIMEGSFQGMQRDFVQADAILRLKG